MKARALLLLLYAAGWSCDEDPVEAGDAGSPGVDAGRDAAQPDADVGGATPGDERAGFVSCGATACEVGDDEVVCCYEADPAGECVSPRLACGTDEQGFGCDGPEDCTSGSTCCRLDGDRVGWCHAACTDDTLCHTRADCAEHETCEPMAHGYARCTSSDDRATPGHDGARTVFCGSEDLVCSDGEICCASDAAEHCSTGCESSESARLCDGPEDCSPPKLCAIDGLATRCIDPEDMSTDGEPFVCHTSGDCSGYGCEPRDSVPELGFCNPLTGT